MSIESSYGSLNSFLSEMETDIRKKDKKEIEEEETAYPSITILNSFLDKDLDEKEVEAFLFF